MADLSVIRVIIYGCLVILGLIVSILKLKYYFELMIINNILII